MSLTAELRKKYAPGVPYEIPVTDDRLHDLLFGSAKRYPKRAALDFMSKSITYEELVAAVRRAASTLARAGVRPGDRVALIMPNCPQHVVAVFACSLLGAIVVEHNPLAPEEELRQEFDRHGARVIVAWENTVEKLNFLKDDAVIFGVNLADDLPQASQLLLRLPIPSVKQKRALLGAKTPSRVRSWSAEVKASPPWLKPSPAKADDPALLIHTGGTTGVPKAVTLSHKNLCSNAAQSTAWVSELHEGAEVFYAVLPLFHAFGFGVSLAAGIRMAATVALFPKFDATQILLSQRRLPCTFFLGVPPIYERLLAAAEELDVDITSIKHAISGAMPIDPELVHAWEAATGGILVEGYGMSEASPIILGSPLSSLRRPSTLGIPFPSTAVKIVDPEDPSREVPEGEIGELIVKGPQVFLGYWDDPDETANVFYDGWLRTGDLVKLVDDFIVMADRRKELIISGGFNVYPTQVEEVVRSMPGISDVAVVGFPAGTRGEDVVAALVLEAGASLTLADVRQWAEKSLAHYALPRQIVVVQELPRSQLGKVMRKRVREQLTEFQTEVEEKIASFASQVSDITEQAQAAISAARAEISEEGSAETKNRPDGEKDERLT